MLDRHTIAQYEVAFLKSKFAAVDGHHQLQPTIDVSHSPVFLTHGELELSKGKLWHTCGRLKAMTMVMP